MIRHGMPHASVQRVLSHWSSSFSLGLIITRTPGPTPEDDSRVFALQHFLAPQKTEWQADRFLGYVSVEVNKKASWLHT